MDFAGNLIHMVDCPSCVLKIREDTTQAFATAQIGAWASKSVFIIIDTVIDCN